MKTNPQSCNLYTIFNYFIGYKCIQPAYNQRKTKQNLQLRTETQKEIKTQTNMRSRKQKQWVSTINRLILDERRVEGFEILGGTEVSFNIGLVVFVGVNQ